MKPSHRDREFAYSVLKKSSLALAIATSFCTTPGFAADSDSTVLEEVLVTAQFRTQNLQQTPIAITAVTASMLEERSQTSILDIANQAPNLTLQRGTAGFGPTMQTFIRGVGQSDFNYAFEPGVGMYIDDVYYSTLTGSIFDLLDLDRVEVLRGPQGTLAGMNSMGGSLKMYSKKPDGNGGGYIEATYGRFDRTDFRASANLTLVPDKLYVRFAGVVRHSDGYVTTYDYACTHPGIRNQAGAIASIPSGQANSTCKIGTEGGKAYDALRASIRWTPTDSLDINFVTDITQDRSEAIPQTLIFVGSTRTTATTPWSTVGPGLQTNGTPLLTTYPRFTTAPTNGLNIWNTATQTSPFIAYSPFGAYNGDTFSHSPYVNYSTYQDISPSDGTAPWSAEPKSEVSGYGFSGQVEWTLADKLKLTSITAYRHYDAYWAQDYDASPIGNALLTYDLWHNQLSEELRLSGTALNDRINWVFGGFYFDQRSHYGGRNELGTVEFIENDEIPATNKAVFANAGWAITDQLEINAGVRYSEEKKTFLFGRGGAPGNTYAPLCAFNGVTYTPAVSPQFCGLNGASGHFQGSNVDYRAVVQYQWTPEFMTYASVATGFKGGGVNPRPFGPEQAVPFGSEKLKAFELGAKSTWFDRKLTANLSVFQNKYTDFIASVASIVSALPNLGCPMNPNATQCSFYINAGDAKVRGAELELSAHPFGGLSLEGSLSLLKFEYTNLTGCSTLLTPTTCAANNGGLGANIRYDMQSPFSPKRKFSLAAQYEFLLGSLGSLTPRVDWSYSSDFFGTAVNTELGHVPGHALTNARLTWKEADGKWQSSLEVTNVTDKLYYYGYFPNGSNGTVVGNPAPPRQWAVSLKYNF